MLTLLPVIDVIGSPMLTLLLVTKKVLGTSPMPPIVPVSQSMAPIVPVSQSMAPMTTDLIYFTDNTEESGNSFGKSRVANTSFSVFLIFHQFLQLFKGWQHWIPWLPSGEHWSPSVKYWSPLVKHRSPSVILVTISFIE
jgi:hypothetical protein